MTAPTEDRADEERHEVSAFYNNLAAIAAGSTYAWPVLDCSCGFSACLETWEEAGAEFDEHVDSLRSST